MVDASKGTEMSRRPLLCAVLAITLLTTGACSAAPEAGTTGGAPRPPGSAKTGSLKPGITTLGGQRVVARGWVAYVDLESGFWAVMSARPQPTESSYMPEVVAVLLPGAVTEEQIKKMRGTFVGAEGVLQQGTSIRMAGPEVVVDGLRVY
jgi:hypothetical protein